MKDKLKYRWFHRAWAHFFGYFWIPCPVCGEMFGGHEASGAQRIVSYSKDKGTDWRVTCPKISCIVKTNCMNLIEYGRTVDRYSDTWYHIKNHPKLTEEMGF